MKQNYPGLSSLFKPNLFLLGFLFFGINGFGQTISKPIISGAPVCLGSEIQVSFTATNGNANSENAGQWFTTSTTYQIVISNGSTTRVLATKPHGTTLEGQRETKNFTFFVQIPETNYYQPGINYSIIINSTNPNVSSDFPSDVFNVKSRPPSPIASNNGPSCAGNTLQLTANNIPNATYNWTGPGGYISAQQNPTRANVTIAMAGTYTVTATVNGCTSDTGTTSVVVNTIPTITGSTQGSRCGTGTVVLGATASAGTINWYAAATGGASLGTGTTFTTPSISSNTTFYVDATSNGCTTGSRSAVVATVKAIPTITGSTQGSRCGTGTVVLGATASSGTINWYAAATGGASLGTGTTFTTPSISSNTTFYVDATSNGCTTGSRSAVLATVKAIPTITGSTQGSRCGTGTVVLGATASAGTINWYAAATGGASLGTGTTFTTPSISSNTTFYVDATEIATSCTTRTRTGVIASVNTIPSAPTAGSNSPVCAGETINLTASSTAGATYSWTGPNGFVSSVQNPQVTTNANAAMAGTYTVTTTIDGCTSNAASTIVDVNASFVWTGATNTDWNTASNWACNSVPTLNTNVVINSGLTNYPILNPGTIGMAKDIQINSGATLIVIDNTLQIFGSVLNSGTFNSLNGSVAFVGISAQTIPTNTFSTNRIRNLFINNNAGVSSSGNLEISGFLKVEKGNFNTGNALMLMSNANQTALIDGSGMGEVLGTVTMQRYLDVAFGYKYFSTPFQNSQVGHFEPYMELSDASTSFPHVYRYKENRTLNDTAFATGWEAYNLPDNPLEVGQGYAFNFGATTEEKLVELTGEVNNGTFSRDLENNNGEYTKGFHLVGNPYPSPIDWDAEQGWIRSNIDRGIYFFTASDTNQYTGTYTAYVNDISTADPREDGRSSNIIPSMQGFFIKVSDHADKVTKVTGSLTVTNQARVTDFDQKFLKTRDQEEKPLLRLTAAFEGAGNKDAMVVYFSPYYDIKFDKETDAHKLMNTDLSVPNLYSLSKDNINLSINALPFPESGSYEKIPLGITAARSGRMQIHLADLQNIPRNWNIYLIDKEKRIGQDLRKKSSYSFSIKEGEHHDRFQLMFSKEKISDPALAFDDKFSVDSHDFLKVRLNLEEDQTGQLRVSTVTGQLLEVKEGRGKEQVEFRSITSSGIYFISLYVNDQSYSKKVLVNK